MLTLKQCDLDELDRLVAVYEVRHTDITGDTITADATIIGEAHGAGASLQLASVGDDIEESIDRLAELCERIAAGLRARGRPRHSLPIFDSGFEPGESPEF